MKRLFLLILVSIFLFFPYSVRAEQIDSFTDQIKVNTDGTINVVETIQYDFENASKHGIFRDIPSVISNRVGTKYKMDIYIESITDEQGTADPYTASDLGESISLKIGDKDRLITGKHTYIVTYRVKGALAYFPDHDELYWSVNGTGWEVPVSSIRADTELPPNTPQDKIELACYTGAYGSTQHNCLGSTSGVTTTFTSTQQLAAKENMTVVIGFPKGLVAVLEPVKYVPFSETPLGRALTFFLIALVFILVSWWYLIYPIWIPIKWLLYGRDPTVGGSVTAWYSPPKNEKGRELTPGETGTLIDERADMSDICATIIDCARRGYVKIVEKKKNDFTIIRLKETDSKQSLQPFEQELLGGIFGGATEVRLKDQQMYETVEATKKKIYLSLTKEKFFPANPNSQRLYYWTIFGIALATINLPLALVASLFGLSMPRKTIFGKQQAHVAESLRRFLVSQERQLAFQAKEQYWFEKLLPYAVAFGVEKIWAKRFDKIDMTPPSWYQGYGYNGFSTYLLVNSMNSSFNSIRASSSPPSSTGTSSGFSGGFSGGGGGGGGGGSW